MPLNITLKTPFISIKTGTGINGYVGLPGTMFGQVSAVYDGATRFAVGNRTVFRVDSTTDLSLTDGDDSYYIIDEKKCSLIELLVP